jgi:hypothetical protein
LLNYKESLRVGDQYDLHPDRCPTSIDVWQERKKMIQSMIASITLADETVSVWTKILAVLPRRTVTVLDLIDPDNSERRREIVAQNFMRWESDYRVLLIQHCIDGIEAGGEAQRTAWDAANAAGRWEMVRRKYDAEYRMYMDEIKAEAHGSLFLLWPWREGEVPVDSARIPLRMKWTSSGGSGHATVYSVFNAANTSMIKLRGVNWLIKTHYFSFRHAWPASMADVREFYEKDFLKSRAAQMSAVFMLKPGDSLEDDLLGGRFRLKTFAAAGGVPGATAYPPVSWSDSPFLTEKTQKYGVKDLILNSYNDTEAVRRFAGDILASRIPPMFLHAAEARRPEPGDVQQEPEAPRRSE